MSSIDWQNTRVTVRKAGMSPWDPGKRLYTEWFRAALVNYDLWFVYRGEGWLRSPAGRTRLRRGICVWLMAGTDYSVTQNDKKPLGILFAHFDLEIRGGGHIPERDLPYDAVRVDDPVFFETNLRRIAALRRQKVLLPAEEKILSLLQANGLLQALLIDYERQATPAPRRGSGTGLRHRKRISAIIKQICAHPQDASTTPVHRLAAAYGYSTAHFSRLFHATTGVSPKNYLLEIRFKEARKMLRHSSYAIGEIAEILGYGNTFAFSKAFRKRTGMSPSQYRASKHSARRAESTLQGAADGDGASLTGSASIAGQE